MKLFSVTGWTHLYGVGHKHFRVVRAADETAVRQMFQDRQDTDFWLWGDDIAITELDPNGPGMILVGE